jgi:hypothetical protein
MENTTRISDLPENIMMQGPVQGNGFDQASATNYIPMNIHPNPYGISAQNPIMPLPQQPDQQQVHQVQQLEQMAAMQRQQEQIQQEVQQTPVVRLPSRDVRLDTGSYTHDEEIRANYIPRPKLTKDYIIDYEETTRERIAEHDKKKHRESRIDQLLEEFQVPIFVTVLFFFFQLPMVNTMVFKQFSFLSIYTDDGNFNIYGLLFKSILFGIFFYSVQKTATFISEF